MGRATVEPNIQNVMHLHPLIGIVVATKETFLGTVFEPAIGTFSFKRFNNPRVDDRVAQNEIRVGWQCVFFNETGQRNPPCPLP